MSCNAFHHVFNLEEARNKASYMKLKAGTFPDSRASLKSVKITEEKTEKGWSWKMIPVKTRPFISFLIFRGSFIGRTSWELSQNFNSGKFTYVDLLETQVKTDCLL